jgi:ParB/RepB/Spo0J family partition protein
VPRPAEVPLHELREPERAARLTITDQEVHELAGSIKAHGLLQPLGVRQREPHAYEVVYGHRRLLALRMLGWHMVPVMVLETDDEVLAARLEENLARADLNPVDEAVYLGEIYQGLGEDLAATAAKVKRSEAYVEARLRLLTGDSGVLEALRSGAISLGVAQELNAITSDVERGYYLRTARASGCTVRQARVWRDQANIRGSIVDDVVSATLKAQDQGAPAPAPAEPGSSYLHQAKPWQLTDDEQQRPCLFCEQEHAAFRMYRVYVCGACADRKLAKPPSEVR